MREIIVDTALPEELEGCDHLPNSATNTMRYKGCATNDCESIHVWECKRCGELIEKTGFRYTKKECPQHYWEFLYWNFEDNPDRYVLEQWYVCFMCGKIHKEPMDVRSKGMRGGVPDGIEHPEVQRVLRLTESVHKRLIED